MPVEHNATPSKQAFIIGLGALTMAIGVILLLTRLGPTNTSSNLANVAGESERPAGKIDELLTAMQGQSGPIPVSDPTGNYQDFYVHHTGDDPQRNWKAYSIVIDSSQKDCLAIWQPEQQHFAPRLQDDKRIFAEPCGEQTYSAEGEGLRQLDVRIEQDVVLVNIDTIEQPQTSSN